MTVSASERRALQVVIALVACVPVLAGSVGAWRGLALIGVAHESASAESHFRYLSGLLLAIGLAYWSCIPAIERNTARLTLLTAIVFVGGWARALSLVLSGAPSWTGMAALAIELGVAPAVWLWQRRVAAPVT